MYMIMEHRLLNQKFKVKVWLRSYPNHSFFFLALINKVQRDFQKLFDPRIWLKNSDNPWKLSLLLSFFNSSEGSFNKIFSNKIYWDGTLDGPYFQTIAKPSVFFPNCRIKIKIAKCFHIFKIWKTLLIYFSCKLSYIFSVIFS